MSRNQQEDVENYIQTLFKICASPDVIYFVDILRLSQQPDETLPNGGMVDE
jgi:hypothetical protein